MSKEAMKLALGKIKSARDCHFAAIDTLLFEAEEILEAALAEQPAQQEPVAVVSGYYGGQCVILPIDPARIFNSNTAFYTSPPAQRKPLTLGQKQKLWSSVGHKPTLKDRVNAYGLAIEAAHGITGD